MSVSANDTVVASSSKLSPLDGDLNLNDSKYLYLYSSSDSLEISEDGEYLIITSKGEGDSSSFDMNIGRDNNSLVKADSAKTIKIRLGKNALSNDGVVLVTDNAALLKIKDKLEALSNIKIVKSANEVLSDSEEYYQNYENEISERKQREQGNGVRSTTQPSADSAPSSTPSSTPTYEPTPVPTATPTPST